MEGEGLKVFSLLVENKPGVLFRVSSHFRRRNYNIESISVGPTERRDTARMVITMMADERTAESFVRLLKRTVDVIEVSTMEREQAIMRELALIKIRANDLNSRNSIIAMCNAFGAKILEVTKNSVMVEITGSSELIDDFISLASDFGIKGVSRTGVTALGKG